MNRYYRHWAESEHGEGVVYFEVAREWPTRQVEVYGDTWCWGDRDHLEHLADQPLSVLELGPEDEISAEEFERVWQEARRRCPSSS